MKKTLVLTALIVVGATVVLAIGSLGLAGGQSDVVKADPMSGYYEGAAGGPVSSVAEGSFEATIDDAARQIHFTLSYSGLEGDVRQAHIHFGQRSVNGGISLWLCETAANPRPVGSPDVPDCPQSGTVEFTLTADHVVGPAGQGIAAGEFEEIAKAIRAGRAYANVHSSKFPGGEVRGQLNDSDQRDS
jgi:CHRD domain